MSRFRGLSIAAALCLAPTAVHAHPHEWIDVASEVLFNDRGAIEAIRHHWRFDEAFSAFALQGLDTDQDGSYSTEELKPLAVENVESLAGFDFFTSVSTGDYQAGFGAPRDYRLELDGDGRLTLHYTLPLAQPLFTKGEVLLQVYDPEYFIALSLPSVEAVRLVGAPAGCQLRVTPAQGPDAQAAAALATIGPEQRELPSGMEDLTGGIDNSASINCGGPTVAGGGGQRAPETAADAVTDMANGAPGRNADLSALSAGGSASDAAGPASAAASAPPAATAPEPAASPAKTSGSFTARLATLQVNFQRQLTQTLKDAKTSNAAFWWLGGISFLYGIVHAAGPGHGKVVISSYLLANEERLRRGIGIAFVSAFAQAVVAIAIVGLMAILLNMTSTAMTGAAQLLETGSFALVLGLGLYLLVSKGRQAWLAWRTGDAHAGHRHHHPEESHHDGSGINWVASGEPAAFGHHERPAKPIAAACGCHHHVAPEALERSGGIGAAAAVLSVGLRPCSGALIILVFALAQGIFWAGVASTFLMALGTAITVAALAALAVSAKDVALRLASGDSRRSAQAMLALEIAAALLVTALGGVLFVGSVAA